MHSLNTEFAQFGCVFEMWLSVRPLLPPTRSISSFALSLSLSLVPQLLMRRGRRQCGWLWSHFFPLLGCPNFSMGLGSVLKGEAPFVVFWILSKCSLETPPNTQAVLILTYSSIQKVQSGVKVVLGSVTKELTFRNVPTGRYVYQGLVRFIGSPCF